jgi:hypothetical protein|tara:strand:- start:138 stop:350 length:213 start_codon:yes stop_codon:yes gene_type:complete
MHQKQDSDANNISYKHNQDTNPELAPPYATINSGKQAGDIARTEPKLEIRITYVDHGWNLLAEGVWLTEG